MKQPLRLDVMPACLASERRVKDLGLAGKHDCHSAQASALAGRRCDNCFYLYASRSTHHYVTMYPPQLVGLSLKATRKWSYM
jgi:hypothetical protein